MHFYSANRRLNTALLWSICLLTLPAATAQVSASGQTLTATTANMIATFHGPDLVGLTNRLTGESYLNSAPSSPLMNLEIQGASSPSLQASSWTTSVQAGTPVASLTMQDSARSVTIAVKVDSSSQEIAIALSGQASQAGVSAAYWALAGLDLSAGHRLIVPASSGIVIDQQHEQLGSTLQYPYDWMAQMAVYETSAGSMVLYSTDSQALFKQLRIASHASQTIDLSVATQPNGPFSGDTSVPAVEWRLKAFAGDWRTAAAVYRDWLAANRPPVSNSNHAWVNNIRTVVQLGTRDLSVLNTLAAEVTPSQTLLYIPDWRKYGYDVNYPDYTPAADVASFVAAAHALGFKVMLHTDLVGVTPSNPDFASVQQYQVKDAGNLQPTGWLWDSPVSTPNRFAWINPASSAYRSLFISRVGAAIAAVQPDALHLDVSAPMFNDGNGLIGGMTYAQGSVQLHQDLIAAFPNIALGGEGTNDLLYRFDSFAQAWASGTTTSYNTALLGHPIANFLWNSQSSGPQVLYYGHLGQPSATDPSFKDSLFPIEREGILPALAINGASDVDLTNPDNLRLNRWLKAWQTNGFQPDWTGSWSGVLIPYKGASNASAALTDTGAIIGIDSGGSTIYQRAHDTNQITTSNYILNWPAFDSAHIYGLNPTKQYWLDPVSRSNATHISSLSPGIELGPDTMVSSGFSLVQLATASGYDFLANLSAATIGTTFNGADVPLGFGATADVASITAGGVTRQGIFMQPPYLQGHVGGEAFVEWEAPLSQPAVFSFSVGVADDAGSCTDGVTFRVLLNGAEAWRQNVLHQGWVDGSVNLSIFNGTTVRVRIATNPGPANNANCDWASFSNLALTPLGGAATSVPLVLGPGATSAGFSGSGTYSAATGVVSGVSVPGEFVLFTAQGSPVSAGTSLASVPFTTWLGAEGDLPVPGTIFNSGTIGGVTSGGVAKQNAIFGHPPSDGRTILTWALALPSTGNLQLGWSAGMGDGSQSSTGVQFSVRVNGVSYWTMFQQTPSGWTAGSLDLSSWRGQNILVQLVTDSVGANDYDWAWWADLKLAQGGAAPPTAPSLSAPANGGAIAAAPTLTWIPSAGATSYDVYFGTSHAPPIVANTANAGYSPGPLAAGTYYWQVAARSATGTAASAIWSFTVSTPVASTISLAPSKLQFGYSGTHVTSAQTVALSFSPPGAVQWTASSNQANIVVSPTTGSGNAVLQISAGPGPSGTITVTAVGATNSPRQVQVTVAGAVPAKPFGSFDTPANNTTGIAGAIPVTGWALDNIETTSVGIWREPVLHETASPNGLVFIGNAVFVAGARPDVDSAYPNTPFNDRAGWGYMLLTNFLVNSDGSAGFGNGTYRLHALAANQTGQIVDLGAHTIAVDNAHASKPFGTIDTPGQGSTVSGNVYVNYGWALTQNPYVIPKDGSTINVFVDGAPVGHPTYNLFRGDIAGLFPGLANSSGAVGALSINTATLTNGVHTIAWSVSDNAGRADGIGSRYFTVANTGSGNAPAASEPFFSGANRTVMLRRGFISAREPAEVTPDGAGVYSISMEELDRIELQVDARFGYSIRNNERRPLPVGSTLQNGTFYWQAGLGFLGGFDLLFERADSTLLRVHVAITPKSYGARGSRAVAGQMR